MDDIQFAEQEATLFAVPSASAASALGYRRVVPSRCPRGCWVCCRPALHEIYHRTA